MVQKWHTYEEIRANEKKLQVPDDGYRHARCVELFSLKYPDIKHIPVWNLKIDLDELATWLEANHLFCDKAKLTELWKPVKFTFANDSGEEDDDESSGEED
jgi:hypothetical protein